VFIHGGSDLNSWITGIFQLTSSRFSSCGSSCSEEINDLLDGRVSLVIGSFESALRPTAVTDTASFVIAASSCYRRFSQRLKIFDQRALLVLGEIIGKGLGEVELPLTLFCI
jgi:hypothetical protein